MLCSYIKAHRKGIGACILFLGIMAGVFALYRLPVAAVAYGALICGFFAIIFLAWDYRGFCRRHKMLSQDIAAVLEYLPEPGNLLEEDYQKILHVLYQERCEQEEQNEEKYQELVDYYTTWVHQIKTPIAAMRLILQGMEAECTQAYGYRAEAVHSQTEESRQELTEELQRIEQYVEMVLCYLRLHSDYTDYIIKEYDLDDLLKQAVRKYASLFIRRKIRLEYEPLGARVVTDEKWLLFVIEQILSNALKYTGSGGVISITLEKPKTLCIRDTGIGIAPEDLPRIFEKGYTGDNGRKDKKASGIGMYLSRQICDNLGHRIFVTSVLGVGTEVRLDLKNAELEVE